MSRINEPYYLNNQLVQMTKGYTSPISGDRPVLSSDMFDYIGHFYDAHHSALKYRDDTKTSEKYGDASQYDCKFYLNQAKMYFQAAQNEPFEVSMLSSYYCMLNLAKSYLAYKSEFVDDFVNDFNKHGIKEDHDSAGKDFDTIMIRYDVPHTKRNGEMTSNFGGVFPMLAKALDSDFDTVWNSETGKSLRTLLYNLPFVQSAYMNTYGSCKNRIEELFVPLADGTAPYYFRPCKSSLKLRADIDEGYLKAEGGKLSDAVTSAINTKLVFVGEGHFESVDSAKRNSNDSISTELKEMNATLRKNFAYVGGTHPMWYIKRTQIASDEVLNISTITINMAIMHRLSEIARYKPEQLHRLMNDKENWLLHEYMNSALNQFVDEMASEITGNDVKLSNW